MFVQLPELQTVILRLVRQRGMQAADAGDVAQVVLAADLPENAKQPSFEIRLFMAKRQEPP